MSDRDYDGLTSNLNTYSTAKAMVCFQRRPGIGADKVIMDAGPAKLHLMGQAPQSINPTNGLYSLSVKSGDSAFFDIFDIRFNVACLESTNMQSISNPSIIYWQPPFFPFNTMEGVQQRLQILGYYTDIVDGKMNAPLERAILEFQADEGSLLIDGDPGPKTKNALQTYFDKNAYIQNTTTMIIRKYFISFKRAITGPSKWNFPHPDNRGGTTTCVSFSVETNGIISWLFNNLGLDKEKNKHSSAFAIGFAIEGGIGSFQKPLWLNVIPNDKTICECLSEQIQKGNSNNVLFFAKKPGDTSVELHLGASSGPLMGKLDVKIVALVQVLIYIHILDIKDKTGKTVTNQWTLNKAEQLMQNINAIWVPAGVEFKIGGSNNLTTVGKYAGAITDEFDNLSGNYRSCEHQLLWQNNNASKRINIYLANEIIYEYCDVGGNVVKTSKNIMGYGLSRKAAGSTGFIGVCIKYDNNLPSLARTIAHELGHILTLTMHPHAHSDDDGTDTPFRHDIWSRQRLMGKFIYYYNNPPHREWQDTGYGKAGHILNSGSLITIKKIPNDGTDNELSIARNAAGKGPY